MNHYFNFIRSKFDNSHKGEKHHFIPRRIESEFNKTMSVPKDIRKRSKECKKCVRLSSADHVHAHFLLNVACVQMNRHDLVAKLDYWKIPDSSFRKTSSVLSHIRFIIGFDDEKDQRLLTANEVFRFCARRYKKSGVDPKPFEICVGRAIRCAITDTTWFGRHWKIVVV